MTAPQMSHAEGFDAAVPHVLAHDVVDFADLGDPTLVEPERIGRHHLHGARPWVTRMIVRPSPVSCAVRLGDVLRERRVTAGQGLVDEQDLGVEEHCDRRAEPHAHALRVRVHREVQVARELRELADLVGELGEAVGRHPAGEPAERDVLPAGERLAEAEARGEEVQSAADGDLARSPAGGCR